jgi:hypothetical protein
MLRLAAISLLNSQRFAGEGAFDKLSGQVRATLDQTEAAGRVVPSASRTSTAEV